MATPCSTACCDAQSSCSSWRLRGKRSRCIGKEHGGSGAAALDDGARKHWDARGGALDGLDCAGPQPCPTLVSQRHQHARAQQLPPRVGSTRLEHGEAFVERGRDGCGLWLAQRPSDAALDEAQQIGEE